MNNTKAYKGTAMEGPVAAWYARITRDEERHSRMVDLLLTRVRPGSRFLEIAPGPGYLSIELARRSDLHVTGLDISKTFVDIARENAVRAGVSVDFRLGNAAQMPFPDETFDFAFCQAAFKNFTQPVRAIAEMHRVLRPGGTAVIVDLRRDASPTEIERHIASLGLGRINRMMTRYTFTHMLLKNAYSVQEMHAMAAQTPFGACRIDTDDIGFTAWMEK